MLDNTAAVWFNEMSDGNAHNLNNAPIVQAGSAGGYFKTGWIINVDTASPGAADLSNGNSMSACTDGTADQMINGTTQSTGTDPKLANAPINKYFCNLMNAMGVKAGADGFPAKGGSAEVTKFGYSDKTEDFIGGAGRGRRRHDPQSGRVQGTQSERLSAAVGWRRASSCSAAALLALACSSGTMRERCGRERSDDALIVPEGLTVTALAGGNGVLDVIALTLRKGPSSTELYAALRNDGDVPACSAAVSVELFDEAEQSLAAGISGLLTQHFYRLTDGSGTIAACVGPGDVTMAAVMDLPSDIAIEDVEYIVYRCPYFALDVVPIDGLSISHVKSVTR